MKIGIPMLLKGLKMVVSHASEIKEKPTKLLSNVASLSTTVGSGLGAATYFGGEEIHSVISTLGVGPTEQQVAHAVVYVAQAVLGLVSLWAVTKKPGTKIDD